MLGLDGFEGLFRVRDYIEDLGMGDQVTSFDGADRGY